MAVETVHVVQSFSVSEDEEYGCDEPRSFKNAEKAIEVATRLYESGKPVIAFSRSGDPKQGEYSDPTILASLGPIPAEIIEAFCTT